MRLKEHITTTFNSVTQWWISLKGDNKAYFTIALLCLAFIGGGLYCIEYEYYAYAFVPLALLGLTFLKYKFNKGLFLIALLTPFSMNMVLNKDGFTLSLPSEPVMILMMVAFLWTILFEGKYSTDYFKHPISISIFIYFLWAIISSCFSTDVLVSFKFIVARLWFVVPMFFVAMPLFKKIANIRTFVVCYSISLFVVIVYSTINFSNMGFEFNASHYVMQPFYNDHTAYGAIVALMLPISLYYTFASKEIVGSRVIRLFFIVMSLALLAALILSYARAAWLSIVVAAGVLVVVKLKIKFRELLATLLIGGMFLAVGWDVILQRASQNSQDSSGKIAEHITSMSNISTDASNIERINRWACALRMFKEEPVFGFGAGTYQFKYAAYQKSWQTSWISTDLGNLGNAHSEYLGPLAEMGIMGALSVIIIFGTTIYIGIRTYRRAADRHIANLALCLTISMITYYTHGIMNNFLDTDKLAVPFWAFTAAIATLDMMTRKAKTDNITNTENNNNTY
jgi:O-antigen ligase